MEDRREIQRKLRIKAIKQELKIRTFGGFRRVWGVHQYNSVIQLDNRIVDWIFEIDDKFSLIEIEAIREFANENTDKLPKDLIEDINKHVEYVYLMERLGTQK